jgi:hypothetical protein
MSAAESTAFSVQCGRGPQRRAPASAKLSEFLIQAHRMYYLIPLLGILFAASFARAQFNITLAFTGYIAGSVMYAVLISFYAVA